MGALRTISHNVKLMSDARRIWGGGIAGWKALREDSRQLKTDFLIGRKIVKRLDLPVMYREHFDLKRTSERIGKAIFFLGDSDPIRVSGSGVEWRGSPSPLLEECSSPSHHLFAHIKKWLPEHVFEKKTSDGRINDAHYVNLLARSDLSVRTSMRPLVSMRARGSLAGFELQRQLAREVAEDGFSELMPSNYVRFEGPVVLNNNCIKLIISDTHVGNGDRRVDDFSPRKRDFIELLEYWSKHVISPAKQKGIKVVLIMNGDMAERWQFEWDEIYRNNKEIVGHLLGLGVDIYYVVGNHDMDVGAYFNEKIESPRGSNVYITNMVVDENGVFVHGHGADPFNSTLEEYDATKRPFGATVTKVGKLLEYIDPHVEEKLEAVKKAFNSGTFDKAYVQHYVAYINELREGAFSGVDVTFRPVLGHTHKFDRGNQDTPIGEHFQGSSTVYYNDGTAGVKPSIIWAVKNRKGEVKVLAFGDPPSSDFIWAGYSSP